MSTRNKEYLELLEHSFNEEKFIKFIIDLLNLDISSLNRNIEEIKTIPNQFKDSIDYYKFVANYNDGMNNIGVFIIKLNDTSSTRARNMQRNFVATLLQKYGLDATLVSFFSDKEKTWRISFVKKELSFTENGVKEKLTSAKRYSYLVGEGESIHTAKEYLLHLLDIDDRKITLSDIEKQFDVEKVTKKFFEEYKEKYLQLKEFLDKNEDFQTEAKNCDFSSEEFAKKLMGQIVFLYFLQKKGWLGVQLVPDELSINEYEELLSQNDSVSQNLIKSYYKLSDNKYIVEKTKLRVLELQEDIINLTNIFKGTKYDMPWGTGRKDFIMYIFNQSQKEHKNFFDDYLEYFFYKGLNEKRDNQFFPLFNCKIPFLNGGLFEPLNNYRWSSAHFEIKNSLFHNDKEDGILDFLNLYNFTIDEEEPLEKEIAVDPEMLGKIFENLLEIGDRKDKGAFYTPREIVHYMCQESLANYLSNKVGVNYDEINQFIKYGDVLSQYDWNLSLENGTEFAIGKTVFDNLIAIDSALIDVKIADPAVGSGAFPLGMLNEIVKLRNNIQTYLLIQKELGLISLENYYSTEHLETDIYKMKLQIIENCIYAVDIETSAVDIAKLRLWLSLVVDYPSDKEPRPLPNLDCKIMQGNSLVDEYQGVLLFSEKIFRNSQRKNAKEVQIQQNIFGDIADIHIQQTLQFDENSVDLNFYIDTMLNLQRQYFGEKDNKLKKELKQKIDSIQMGMIEETLKDDYPKFMRFQAESKKRKKQWFIWQLEFYDVFKENGGFDIVIGNPPYVGEKGNKDIFRPIANSKFGQKYYQGKMDLFYFFFHKGLDLLKNNGILSFITTNYYITADGAKNLRKDFYDRSDVLKLINFNEYKIFESALGQHNLITILRKNIETKNNDNYTKLMFSNKKGYLGSDTLNTILNETDKETIYFTLNKKELFDGEEKYIRFIPKDISSTNNILSKIQKNSQLLIYICNINSGCDITISEIMNKHIDFDNSYNKGDGVFVLKRNELNKMIINPNEEEIIKDFIKNSNIHHFCYELSDRKLIYLTWNDNIEDYPNIKQHLIKYKPILDDQVIRYEENYPWFALHRPREIQIFNSDKKIISPYRSRKNYFALSTEPVFSSRDVFYMTPKFDNTSLDDMKYLVGLLNSKTYYYWLFNKGKRKGDMLELYYKPLSEIPIIVGNDDFKRSVIALVDSFDKNDEYIINEIDNLIYKEIKLTDEEIKEIESTYNS